MPPWKLVPRDYLDFCPKCDGEVVPGDVALDNIEYTCDICKAPLAWGDTECLLCQEQYAFEYWEGLLEGFMVRHLTNELDVIDGSEAYFLTLCCNRDPELCGCDIKLEWNDGNMIPKNVEESAYEYTSECSSCLFYYTAQCLPYRSWMREFLLTGAVPGEIDYCSLYRLDERTVSQTSLALQFYEGY